MKGNSIYSINEITDLIVPILQKYRAQKAILFGSYARKEADENSDIDVMVIGGKLFDLTDIFCIADDLHRASNKDVDVYEISEIDNSSELYNNIIKEGIEIA